MTSRTVCSGTGQSPVYRHGEVHPHCPVCGADLSVQGKHQKVVGGVIRKHYVEIAASYRIGWGFASHRARRVFADGSVVTFCGRNGLIGGRAGSSAAYPEKGEPTCGTCRRHCVRLGIPFSEAT